MASPRCRIWKFRRPAARVGGGSGVAANVGAEVERVVLVAEVAIADLRIRAEHHGRRDLDRVLNFEVVPAHVLSRELDPEAIRNGMGGAELASEYGPLARGQRNEGSGTVDGGSGDDVHDARGGVRPVQRGAGPEGDLDAVDIQVARGDQVEGVESKGRDPRVAVVDDRQQRSRKHVVETARHDVLARQAGLEDVEPGLRLDIIRGGCRNGTSDFGQRDGGHPTPGHRAPFPGGVRRSPRSG